MSECLGCKRLDDENAKLVQLHTGQKVCSYCPEWMLETEAMELLAKPLKERQRILLVYEAQRKQGVNLLKSRLAQIHKIRKSLQKGQLSL